MAEPTDEDRAEQIADELLKLFDKVPHLREVILPKLLTFEVGLSKHDHHLKTLYVQNLTKDSQAAWVKAEQIMKMKRQPPPAMKSP